MRDYAVVLTYPGHFLLTTLTLRSIWQHFPEIKKITVLADDIAESTPPSYISDCENKYQCEIVPLSQFEFLHPFANNGWIRQQIAKLHLDLILNSSSWFFSDGDIGFTSHIPFGCTPHGFLTVDPVANPVEYDRTIAEERYIKELLGDGPIMIPELLQPDSRLCTNVAAFRDMNADLLVSLRQYVEHRLDVNFIDKHYNAARNPNYLISEWELIESYRTIILKQTPDWFFCPPVDYNNFFETLPAGHPRPYFYTIYGGDGNLSKDWWDRIEEHLSSKI